MRFSNIVLSLWLAIGLVTGSTLTTDKDLERRQQNTASDFPTLGSASASASVSVSGSTVSATSSHTTSSQTPSSTNSVSANPSSSASSSITSADVQTSNTASMATSTTAPTSTPAPAANSSSQTSEGLPLTPTITPALSIGGVILILTGIVYALIGIKNRWIHIFLSTAYLTSLSICVLIVYVMNPPVSNAIQGAYFVGIFMTGIIFGAGALIFKEVTEGLGCLLGGFTLAMWFLTLKDGGLITSTTGKAIFITVFCVLAWSLSFSHHTRAYGLMGSTSLSGATAFVLGIDCFSRGGLKEFWLYIWSLNPNLFPVTASTYPITRGTRVETVVIILGCIIGVISQLKLWKVVQDRQKRKEAANLEEERRREAVEAALGKHLERRNDRDRTEWEKQYGDRLNAKRETILWSDTIAENKKYARITETEVEGERRMRSSSAMEMSLMPRQTRSVYVGRLKRQQSTNDIDAIQEEKDASDIQKEQEKSLAQLEGHETAEKESGAEVITDADSALQAPKSQRDSKTTVASSQIQDGAENDVERAMSKSQDQLAPPEDEKKKKRLSWSSMFSRSAKDGDVSSRVSQSQEALVVPATTLRYSRASSLAATLDFENEVLDLPAIDNMSNRYSGPPEIVVSEVETTEAAKAFQREREASFSVVDAPPSPPALEENFDIDPEELVRPPTVQQKSHAESRQNTSGPNSTRRHSEAGSDEAPRSHTVTSDTSVSEVLTKGVLERVPNHLSNVVMSYRTNEWAKHIATAEAPVYEESQSIDDEQNEAPAHLAAPEELQNQVTIAEPPPLANVAAAPGPHSPVEAAISSPTQGVRVNPAVQTVQRSSTNGSTRILSRTVSASDLNSANIPRGFRSSSSPLLNQQAFSTNGSPAVEYNPRQSVMRSASAQIYSQMTGGISPAMSTAPYMMTDDHAIGTRSGSRLSLVPENSTTQGRSQSPFANKQILRPRPSETRLQSFDSHQPARRDDAYEAQRREAVLAEWRNVHQKQSEVDVDGHRMQMVMQKQQIKAMEEYEKNIKLQQEMALDARMRSRDMQELHREAMRKMQANANKNLH